MNQKFKLKLLAILATVSGTALGGLHGNCLAQQAENGNTAFGSGVVRVAEPAYDGAFGAVTPASYNTVPDGLPPIVSANAEHADYQPMPTGRNSVPPIVKAPPLVTPDQTPQKQNPMGLLAPMAVSQAVATPDAGGSSSFPEVPIIQATGAPVDAEDDSNVEKAQWGQPAHLVRGVSSAGVPIYQGAAPTLQGSVTPPIVPGGIAPAPISVPPIVSGSVQAMPSSMPPIISPQSQMVSPSDSMVPPAPIPVSPAPMGQGSSVVAPPMMSMPSPPPTYFNTCLLYTSPSPRD